MRNMKRKALFAAAAVLALAGCGSRSAKSEGTAAGGGRQSVMIYSSLKESQLAALKEGFMKRHPNIAMDFYTASTGNVMTKLATEQQAGGIAADLIWVGDPTNYIDFKKQGLLYAYDSPAAADIPAKFKDPDRMFMSARLIMLGFVYNTRRLTYEQAPKTWEDLLNPRFRNNIAMTDPTSSGTTLFTVAGLVQNPRYGWDFLRKLKAHGMLLESGSSAVVNKVGSDEYLVSVGVDYIARSAMAQGATLGFVYPERDIPIIESPIAIIRNSKNLDAAKALYDYIISEEGQQVLLEEYTLPINPKMRLDNAIEVAEAEKRMLPVDHVALVTDKNSLLEKFDSIFK
ncbi:MAG TPA: ABC transporter substrate-binding protein [Spirochaetia bacterium]|nr:ABC transporter substrate-binding protein [Spirochaetales bacterium]HRY80497.1 ABC transporter substrate-binding protein [Spirochaetia bacterium]